MFTHRLLIISAVFMTSVFLASVARADYALEAWTFTSAGGWSGAASNELLSSFGHSQPIGQAKSPNYQLDAGFLFPPPPAYGDVNRDGFLSAEDASLILQYVVGIIQLSDEQIKIGDVSGNGSLTAFDATLILMKITGLIDKFPVER